MTEQYWQRYKQQLYGDPMHRDDPFWKNVRNDLKRREKPKHHLELYTYCKTDNPFIRQIKSSPNITIDTVAEMICRDKACELQYCLSIHKLSVENRRANIDLQGCTDQYTSMTECMNLEKNRIKQKEIELREKITGEIMLQQEKPIENIKLPVLVQKEMEMESDI